MSPGDELKTEGEMGVLSREKEKTVPGQANGMC